MLHTTDQDLLLLAHDELPMLPRIAAQTHFAICSQCQTRFAKLVGASRLLADAVRDGELPRWPLPNPREAIRAAQIAMAWRITTLILLIATSVILTKGIVQLTHRPAGQIAAPQQSGGPCRPDLHSDNCQ